MEEPNPYKNRQVYFISHCTVSQKIVVMTLKLGICIGNLNYLFVLDFDILLSS